MMKINFNKMLGSLALLIFAALFNYSVVYADVLDDLLPGHWAAISLNKIVDVDPCPMDNCTYSLNEGVDGVIDDWTGSAFIEGVGVNGGMIAFGGGHKGYGGNEIYLFSLDTYKWVRYTDPAEGVDCDGGTYLDGSPCTAHTYDTVEYHPGSNSFVMASSPGSIINSGVSIPTPRLFSFDENKWRAGGDRISNDTLTGASSAYDPNRDAMWLLPAFNKKLAMFDFNANNGFGAWTEYNRFNIEIDAVSSIDPIHDLLVSLDGRGERIVVHELSKLDEKRGYTQATTGDKTVESRRASGFEWDPVSKVFVAWAGGTDVYKLDPFNWQWSRVPAATSNTVSPTAPNPNGTYSRWQYVPSKNVFIVINDVKESVYAYRLNDHVANFEPASQPKNLQLRVIK